MLPKDIDWKFECTNCGYCCRHEPGFVFLTETDLIRLVRFVEMPVITFVQEHCREVLGSGGSRVSLKEKENHDCEFWTGGCTVYEARPQQCRSYPFWPNIVKDADSWSQEKEYCPGIGRGESLDISVIREKLSLKDDPLISYEDACKIS